MDGLVFYAKTRAFEAKATSSRPRNLALRPRISIPDLNGCHVFKKVILGQFCSEDDSASSDDELFIRIRTYSNHILHGLLPPPSTASQNYKDSVHTHLSYLNAQHIFLTVISLCV